MTGGTTIDKRALRILKNAYWGTHGWTQTRTTAEDFAYAKAAGYMFDPVHVTHDDIVDWLLRSRARVSLPMATDAFLASLSTRRLDWRSALGSLAYATCFPEHGAQHAPNSVHCAVCGTYDNATTAEDLSILNFERWKWGGARHTQPLFCAFDLQQFAANHRDHPTDADIATLANIIRAAEALPERAKPGTLVASIAKLLSSNAAERRVLIEILAMCGILACPNRPGFLEAFTDARTINRDRPRDHSNDWAYPAIWWRGGRNCVDRERLAQCFPAVADALAQ